MAGDVPDWCRRRAGAGAVLIVAPHGGSRHGVGPAAGGAKVNDLHTADLAGELADRLDAGLLVNPTVDRNQLDLNRVSQVVTRAPWFLAALERLLDGILTRHDRAEVLFLHGWNTIEPKCDIGIGLRLGDGAPLPAAADTLTVSPGYLAARLSALRAACATAGIEAPFGERYPGRHPNNLLQLFRRGHPHPAAPPRLAAWIAAGRVEAVQLELGVPVRWPGPLRQAFTATLDAVFRGAAIAPSRRRPAPPPPCLAAPAALQAFDPSAGVGLAARLETSAGGRTASRLLLFLGRRRVALFTGETQPGAAGGPRFEPCGDGFRLRFDGALLVTDDASLYVDLESAFRASALLALRAELRFAPGHADYGRIAGALEIDGRRVAIETFGFARAAAGARGAGAWHSQLSLLAAFGPSHALRLQHAVPGVSMAHDIGPGGVTTRTVDRVAVRFDGDPYAPDHLLAGAGDDVTVAEPIARMAIRRPLAPGHHARVTFGIARVRHRGRDGFGFFEYARAVAG